jgi:hypothetical protein
MKGMIHIKWSGPFIKLPAPNGEYYFEMHSYMGPMRLKPNGEPHDDQWAENSQFWGVFEAWLLQGERVDENGRGIIDDDKRGN